jgi:hypothetical protein
MNIHLGGRKADAAGVVHGFNHVIDQRAHLIVNRFNRGGGFPQPVVREG